jgi:hypothetical protein
MQAQTRGARVPLPPTPFPRPLPSLLALHPLPPRRCSLAPEERPELRIVATHENASAPLQVGGRGSKPASLDADVASRLGRAAPASAAGHDRGVPVRLPPTCTLYPNPTCSLHPNPTCTLYPNPHLHPVPQLPVPPPHPTPPFPRAPVRPTSAPTRPPYPTAPPLSWRTSASGARRKRAATPAS